MIILYLKILLDIGILNTMRTDFLLAKRLLFRSGISLLDAARLVRGIIDFKPSGENSPPSLQYCRKVIECGLSNYRKTDEEMSIQKGFILYLESKLHLRSDSKTSLRYLGRRLIRTRPQFACRNFSSFSPNECESWLKSTFSTPSQFNKGRTMLHGFFQFALRKGWCDKNPVAKIDRRKVEENEIKSLSITEVRRLMRAAATPENKACMAAVGLMVFAGIRPGELRRLHWADIDLKENFVVIRSRCSKTGGTRHVEIFGALKRLLKSARLPPEKPVCPDDWMDRWRLIRSQAGFKNKWVRDVLRHTYASYHAKKFRDLPRLQLNMGHRDLSLLRSRYVNMEGINNSSAEIFFGKLPAEFLEE